MPAAAGTAFLIGAIHFALWLIRVPPRWSATGAITMKTNMALALALAGAALLLLRVGDATPRRRAAAIVLASLVLLVGGLTLVQHLLGIDLGIDQLLATEPPGQPGTASPNRIGPPGALSLTLVGAGLLALTWNRRASIWLGAATCGIALIPAVGMLYGVTRLYANPHATAMAWPTLVGLLALGVGISLAESGHGSVRLLLWRDDAGGVLLRRALGPAILLPVLFGFLSLVGERRGLYDLPLGIAMLAISLSFVFSLLVWRSARRLSAAAAARARAEEQARWRASLIDLTHDAVLVWSRDRGIESWNHGAEELYGYAASEALGRTPQELLGTAFPRPSAEIEAELNRAGRWEGDLQHRTKAGALLTVVGRLEVLAGSDGRFLVLESHRDISAAKRAEEALSRSEEQLRLALRAADLGTWDYDLRTGEVFWDERFKAIYGVTADRMAYPEIIGSVIHPDDSQRLDAAVERTLDPRGPDADHLIDVEYRVAWPDGSVRWVQVKGQAFFEGEGAERRAARFIGMSADITARKQAEEELAQALRTAESERQRLATVLEELRASEARLRALMSASSEVVYRMSPDWAEMRQLRGGGFLADTEEPTRAWLRQYIHPDDQPEVLAAIEEAIRTKSVFQLEHRVWRADGTLGWASSRAVPVMDDHGEIVEWFGAAADITERRRAEQALRDSEAQLRAVYQQNPALVVLSDLEDGRIIQANEGFTRMLGFSLEEALGRTPVELGILPTREERLRVLETVRQRGSIRNVEVTVRAKSGSGVTGLLSSSVIEIGGQPRLITVIADITARKRAEEELRAANERLNQSDRRKNEFLAVLSHELRNPLAPIRNSVYILEHAASGGEQAKRARQVIDRQAQHMTRLIDDLLDVTRISRGKIKLQHERVELDALARATAEDLREVFTRNGIELTFEGARQPLWVNGDSTRLAQVIGNLLHNSAKFTARGGKTVLSVEANRDGEAVLRVGDSGTGMSPETLQHLFEPFMQAEQTLERTRGGLGLGLALAKGLVEMHGGRITVHSEGEGKGSEFTVSLPLESPARPKLAVVPAPNPSTRARRVLVVEDNVDAADSLREALELGDHEVEVAHTGPEGVEAARKYKPEVVLCDIGLPEMDGYGVARALRADPDAELRSTFLVALSGYALQEDVAKSKEAGFDQHLAKPPSIESLEKLLGEAPVRAKAG